jgi:ribosomal 50S subunit-associated protein YjgA (DUF615 family)
MLDRAFMNRMFDQIEQASDEELAEKEAAIAKYAATFPKNSEAAMDARFMLRHVRRERAERLFRPPLAS